MEEIKTELQHMRMNIEKNQDRIKELENESKNIIVKFAKIETTLTYTNKTLDNIDYVLEEIKKERKNGYKQWVWIVITAITSGSVGLVITKIFSNL